MDYKEMIGFGVAGNVTGHLDQAGEAGGFQKSKGGEEDAPKGIFPFYVPVKTGKCTEVYPFSSNTITYPLVGENLQIEPELAIICRIQYEKQLVKSLTPISFGAFNDCSIRKLEADKLSEKKNWGPNSKGISDTIIEIDKFSEGGVLDDYNIVAYLLRDGILHPYGCNSPISKYSYVYEELLVWIVSKMNTQVDEGPLECISDLIRQAKYPEYGIIGIGATNYTDFGKNCFLKPDDEGFVVVYSTLHYDTEKIETLLKSGTFPKENISILHQKVL